MTKAIVRGSGDVFRDLGFRPAESARLRVRSQLMSAIQDLIRSRGLTQSEAAKVFGVTQPRISDLARGRIDLFSIDGLVDMLARASIVVRVHTAEAKARRRGAA